MKRLFKIVIPAILMFLLVYALRGGKNILEGLYILFPMIYLCMGFMASRFVSELLIGMIVTSLAFIIPIHLWYHMGTCIELIFIYALLGCVGYLAKKFLIKKRKKAEKKS